MSVGSKDGLEMQYGPTKARATWPAETEGEVVAR